ncbi:MAG: helix-hairpin-helix domain-containing protein [Prevotellaceae bacterium]|jgi:DNA uptake protein ComE-like DNA-binding protein|nr:helix-hairpin-helix domain-containing protein [Prevotellaceae bacterium]
MFKLFLYFTKEQKVALIAFLILLALAITASQLVHLFVKNKKNEPDVEFIAEYQNFEKSLQNKKTDYQQFSPLDYGESQNFNLKNSTSVALFAFNPNKLDSAGFIKLGLKPYVVKNILNYRTKGGFFEKIDDFEKIYGLSANDFEKLKPFIKIQPKEITQNKDFLEDKKTTIFSNSDTIQLELNSADTTQLKLLRGIGSGYARAIVGYRNRLGGGFYSVSQLLEINNFSLETLKKIEKNLSVDASLIQKIEVNRATVEKLKLHPYINFYQAKAIYELRRKNTVIHSIETLKPLKELTDEDIEKLFYYLDFKGIERTYR